jgi:hypothetical protein
MPSVEVVYALPDRQRVVAVPWRPGITAQEAVQASGLVGEFPDIAGRPMALGVFGQPIDGRRELREGDRVEIYRPLQADPREARRRRLSGPGSGGRGGRGR